MPDHSPKAILGRIAVYLDWQGKGIGIALVFDAALRTWRVAHIMGIRRTQLIQIEQFGHPLVVNWHIGLPTRLALLDHFIATSRTEALWDSV